MPVNEISILDQSKEDYTALKSEINESSQAAYNQFVEHKPSQERNKSITGSSGWVKVAQPVHNTGAIPHRSSFTSSSKSASFVALQEQ